MSRNRMGIARLSIFCMVAISVVASPATALACTFCTEATATRDLSVLGMGGVIGATLFALFWALTPARTSEVPTSSDIHSAS